MTRNDRLLIVSNRLPTTARVTTGGIETVPSSGGLTTGLRAWHQRSDALWLGWPGTVTAATVAQREELDRQLREQRMVAVHLSADQVNGHYHGFANRVLWPLFHYASDRLPVDAAGWETYREVNEAFADEVAREYRSGDTIWVHDYQLMLVPRLVRERLPEARIGFFLHIPFPASEVFRMLPWRSEMLHGILGADLVGFHTFAYMRHFITSLLHVEGLEADIDVVRVAGREVTLGAFPMGIDADCFATLAEDPEVRARIDAIRRDAGGRRIILGVDRLDYTKGIPLRLKAVECLLEHHPALRDDVRYIQIAVPSRCDVDSYQEFGKQLEQTVGHLNGTYGTLRSLPIHFVNQSVGARDLVALYGAADVMLVTPIRDGMNLVAKEFVASRVDDDGVLVLSEFAGAAAELNGAITVNPHDTQALADNIHRALSMPVEERRARMRSLRRRVVDHDVHKWAASFLQRLHDLRPGAPHLPVGPPARSLAGVLADTRRTRTIRLLLDYDGTLVPLARSPELAVPDDELLFLLEGLAASPGIQIDIVSGRPPEALQRWFGHLPISLWAEHGFWHRPRPGGRWEPAAAVPSDWMIRIRPILDQFAASTPGAQVEAKTASLAWHYRGAPRDFGQRQAHELRLLLGDLLSNQPLEVLEGKKVIEVRLRGIGKGIVVQRVQAETGDDIAIVAIGDDRTDDAMFRAVPRGGVTVAVGHRWTSAMFYLDDYRGVRRHLRSLVTDQGSVEKPTSEECMRAAVPA